MSTANEMGKGLTCGPKGKGRLTSTIDFIKLEHHFSLSMIFE